MEMTFDQYIQNPMGVKNAVISGREMYRTMYMNKLDKIMVRENGKAEYHLFKDKGELYYAYIKVPSEVIENFYYDVIIEFRQPDKDKKIHNDRTLKNYKVRFYSNDPSFVFTFAHAFIKNDMFIKNYSDKMSKEAIKKVAKEKNPTNQVGYVKSLYFAYLIMSKRRLFDKNKYLNTYNESAVKRNIIHATKKIEMRQQAAEDKRIQLKKDKDNFKRDIARSIIVPGSSTIKQTSKSRIIKTSNTRKTSNNIKKVRKSKKI